MEVNEGERGGDGGGAGRMSEEDMGREAECEEEEVGGMTRLRVGL